MLGGHDHLTRVHVMVSVWRMCTRSASGSTGYCQERPPYKPPYKRILLCAMWVKVCWEHIDGQVVSWLVGVLIICHCEWCMRWIWLASWHHVALGLSVICGACDVEDVIGVVSCFQMVMSLAGSNMMWRSCFDTAKSVWRDDAGRRGRMWLMMMSGVMVVMIFGVMLVLIFGVMLVRIDCWRGTGSGCGSGCVAGTVIVCCGAVIA